VPEEVVKSTAAGKSLCMWARAILIYTKVVKQIEPLKADLAKMNAEFDKANGELQVKMAELEKEKEKVRALEAGFKEAKANKEKLDKEIDLTQLRLERAEKLTSGLSGEHDRWKENITILEEKIRKLVGDVFVSSACISYYGPFTGIYRNILTDKWVNKCNELKIPASDEFKLETTMGDHVKIQDWNMYGLPSDQVSICNAIMINRGLRKPFLIDPQLQGTTWIKNMGEEK
jgi:dynein heavy chain